MKILFKTLSIILVGLTVAASLISVIFVRKYFWEWDILDEDGHSPAEAIVIYCWFSLYVLRIVTAVSVLPLLIFKRWRSIQFALVILGIIAISWIGTRALTDPVFNQGRPQKPWYSPQNGDVIFHTSQSPNSKAIQELTKSPLSHVGIIFVKNGSPMVYEAIGPVQLTPLRTWVGRGDNRQYTVMRLKNSETLLTPDAIKKMMQVGDEFRGLPYDHCFEWSDNAIYCSELVWKIYDRGIGLKVGELQRLSEFEFNTSAIQEAVANKPNCQFSDEEIVVTPVSIFSSDLFELVHQE